MKLEEFCTMLHNSLSAEKSYEGRLETAVKFTAKAFSVNQDEIAVFLLDANGEALHFAWPLRLRDAGVVPVSAANPLVAKTAREKKGFLNNSFAVTPHASYFELFHGNAPRPLPIQKIMSAPLTRAGQVKGVVQVSRKASDITSAGPDFSRNELLALERIASIIGDFLSRD